MFSIGLELQDKQNLKEDLSCLPSLKVEDLSKVIKAEPMEMNHAGQILQNCGMIEDFFDYRALHNSVIEKDSSLLKPVFFILEIILFILFSIVELVHGKDESFIVLFFLISL